MLRKVLKRALRGLGYEISRIQPLAPDGTSPEALSITQQKFVQWNAERLGISVADSMKRYVLSSTTFKDGHGGAEYRDFDLLCNRLLQVFYGDGWGETIGSYQFYGPIHFLRFLSYAEEQWAEDDPVVLGLGGRSRVSILDFGCGLAQHSRGLAQHLQKRGVSVELFLVDIPTLRKDFLIWLGANDNIPTTFLDCTVESRIPDLPECDVCFATEFFEHVYNPLDYLERIHGSLRTGGLLVTNVADHEAEFLHVSPNLKVLRDRLHAPEYEVLRPNVLYRKRR